LDPTAQIFFNSVVASDASLTEATGARVEHPLVICRTAPDNKREEQTTKLENKFSNSVATHPRPRYTKGKICQKLK